MNYRNKKLHYLKVFVFNISFEQEQYKLSIFFNYGSKLRKAKKIDVLLSSGSFDKKNKNINMFLFYPKLTKFKKTWFKKYGDDMKINVMTTPTNIYNFFQR